MLKAIQIYPLTQRSEFSTGENEFLIHFFIDFYSPSPKEAIFKRKHGLAPRSDWFLLFDEAEKEIQGDEYNFYGISYRTSVKLASKRLRSKIKKLEDAVEESQTGTKMSRFYVRNAFSRRNFIRDMYEALRIFNPDDEITINFIVAEWPNEDDMGKKEYIKYFEDKIFGRGKFAKKEIPF